MSGDCSNQVLPPSRSPSPASAPPVLLTPGPRASALQKLYSDAITHVVKTCSYSNFSSCFPTPAQQVPQSIKLLHEQFTYHLSKNMHEEFDDILEERDVVSSLNQLDRLVEEARKRKAVNAEGEGKAPVVPHTLTAQTLYTAHVQPSLYDYMREMKTKEDSFANENTQILERVLQQRRDISSLLQGLESTIADIEDSVAQLNPAELEALRDETQTIDQGMRIDD